MSYKIVEIPLSIGTGVYGFHTPETHIIKFKVKTTGRSDEPSVKCGLPVVKTLGPPVDNVKVFRSAKNREPSTQSKFITNEKSNK